MLLFPRMNKGCNLDCLKNHYSYDYKMSSLRFYVILFSFGPILEKKNDNFLHLKNRLSNIFIHTALQRHSILEQEFTYQSATNFNCITYKYIKEQASILQLKFKFSKKKYTKWIFLSESLNTHTTKLQLHS